MRSVINFRRFQQDGMTSASTAAKNKDQERAEIARQTEEFLAKGGRITKLDEPEDRTATVFHFNNPGMTKKN